MKVVLRKLDFEDMERNLQVLREIKLSGEIHLVLDCEHARIRTVMKQAQSVGMMTAYHNYLITNLVS